MRVAGLDHVNIVTSDVDGTVRFYADVLGLTRAVNPGLPAGWQGCWLCDPQGAAIIHLQGYNPARHGAEQAPGSGRIDHVALACTGFAAMLERCAALGIEPRVNDRQFGDLRQIFVTDPNGVSLELNFAGD